MKINVNKAFFELNAFFNLTQRGRMNYSTFSNLQQKFYKLIIINNCYLQCYEVIKAFCAFFF